MFLQINDIDRNIYMIASIVKDGTKVIYKMINGTQLQETFDTEQEAESKYEEAIESTGGGGGGNIPLDPDGKIPAEYLPSYVDDVIDLLAVTDTAPSSCAEGDKYYNTTEKKIFTASATDTWGSTGKTPEKDKIYVNTADDPATSWRWSGSDLVLIGGGAIVDVARTEYLLPEDIYGSGFPVFLYRYSMILNIGSTWDISSAGQLDSAGNNPLDILPKMVMYCLNDLLSSIDRESYSYIGFDIGVFNYNYDQFLTLELRTDRFRNTGTPENVYGFAIKKQDKKENVYTTYSLNLTYSNDGVITRVLFKNKAMQDPTLIPTDNIIAYTPTQDYHPATKKYVDDNMGNIQYSTLPTASAELENEIVQYVGATENGYTKGYFYVCNAQGTNPETYAWEQINVQPQGSSPSPDLPTNGVRLLKKAANSVQALNLIDDPAVDDACLVLTDEVIEHVNNVPIDFMQGLTAGETIKFNKKQSFTFTGDVSILNTVPNINLAVVLDQDIDRATEWLGFNIAGPNPSDNSSWYAFEFIAGSSSPAASLRKATGIINAWVCENPETDPTFRYIEDGELVASLVDSFGYDVYEYGLEEYAPVNNLTAIYDDVSLLTQGQEDYKAFIDLPFSKDIVTTETYKKSDLYTYNGSEWVYRDRNLSANANWDENDPTAPGYVRGRTHYVIPGNGETLTTIDLNDGSIYSATEGKPIDPDKPEKTQTAIYVPEDVLDVQDVIDFYDKLEELYNEGYSSSDKTITVEYGSRRNPAYIIREEVQGERPYIAYYIVGKDEQLETYYDGNSDLGFEFGVIKDYQGSEFIGYYVYMDIYTEVYDAENSCKVLSVVEGSKDQVVKLDPKFIPQTADWNENNSNAAGYIANRTHYKEVGTETRNIATEDLSEFDISGGQTEESVDFYTSHLEYRKNLENPQEEEGNIKAKDLFTDLSIIYDNLGSGTEISIKIGDIVVSGKLLKYTHVTDPQNKSEMFVVATDGGEIGDEENPIGTTADKFMTDSQNSSGVLLAVSYEMTEEAS